MAVNGKHCIFRLTDGTNTTETSVSDKIEFDNDNAVPDARAHIISIKPTMQAINTDNPNPGSQASPNSQDTGNAPIMLELKGYFDENAGVAAGIETVKDWMNAAKVIKTLYPKGRFGFRSSDRAEWNIVPVATSGYQIVHFELEDVVEYNIIPFIIRLKHVGAKAAFS